MDTNRFLKLQQYNIVQLENKDIVCLLSTPLQDGTNECSAVYKGVHYDLKASECEVVPISDFWLVTHRFFPTSSVSGVIKLTENSEFYVLSVNSKNEKMVIEKASNRYYIRLIRANDGILSSKKGYIDSIDQIQNAFNSNYGGYLPMPLENFLVQMEDQTAFRELYNNICHEKKFIPDGESLFQVNKEFVKQLSEKFNVSDHFINCFDYTDKL